VSQVDAEIAAIEKIMKENRPLYDRQYATRYAELLAAREARVDDATSSLPDDVVAAWREGAGVKHHLTIAQATAQTVFNALEGEEELAAFQKGFDALPAPVVSAVYQAISVEPGFAKPASEAAVAEFSALGGECEALVRSWGGRAEQRLGVMQGRVNAILKSLPPAEQTAAKGWLDGLPPRQVAAVAAALAGRGR